MIPAVDRHTGLLPTTPDRSPHAATVDEVYQTFVVGAPHRGRRQLIWDAFSIYSQLLWGYFPDAQLWLNGGFVTHKRDEPHDLDIAFLVPTSELEIVFNREPDSLSLLTLQGVTVEQPTLGRLPRVQPFGGLIDSFYVPSDIEAALETWKDRWSLAPDPSGQGFRSDLEKGFLEVGP